MPALIAVSSAFVGRINLRFIAVDLSRVGLAQADDAVHVELVTNLHKYKNCRPHSRPSRSHTHARKHFGEPAFAKFWPLWTIRKSLLFYRNTIGAASPRRAADRPIRFGRAG